MQRIALAGAALAVAMFVSPVSAQQNPPEQQPLPVSPPESVPPPLPPMPSARHRSYDMGEHHAAKSHHHATSTTHHQTKSKHQAAGKHHATHEKHQTKHASKRTIRECHKMTYQQIMKHSSCRDLMRGDLETAEHKSRHAAHHKGSAHHKSTTHHKSTSHHKTTAHHHSK